MFSAIDSYDTQGKWCGSWRKNTPKLKFGRHVNNVLNLNLRTGREILLRFPKKIQDGG